MWFKSPFIRAVLISLWVPIVWATLVTAHVILFSIPPRYPGLFVYLFDRAVMLSCFLLYPVREYAREWSDSLIPFAAQFSFWWFWSFVIHLVLLNRKSIVKT